jgi:hypothetical protein
MMIHGQNDDLQRAEAGGGDIGQSYINNLCDDLQRAEARGGDIGQSYDCQGIYKFNYIKTKEEHTC